MLFQKSLAAGLTDSTQGVALPAFGTIRALVVYVRFPEDTLPNAAWPWQQTAAPACAAQLYATDSLQIPEQSITNYFRVMSRGKMMFLGDTYPEVITLQHEVSWYQQNGGAGAVNKDALLALKDVPWSVYDNWSRQNGRYLPEPDGVVDYVLIVYRTSPVRLYPAANWIGANGGVGALFGNDFEVAHGMRVRCGSLQSGATVMGMHEEYSKFFGLSLHELAHFYTLHHYSASNDNYGTDFLLHGGWGLAAASGSSSPCANAWDRHKLGWEPITFDFTANRKVDTTFWLKGIVESGEMARIEIPYVKEQWFWLEYHTARNYFDKIDGTASGLYIQHQTGQGPHHLDVEEADGNWDWGLSDSGKVPTYCCGEWQLLIREAPNPMLGAGDRDILKLDKDKNGLINRADYVDVPVLAIQGEPQLLRYEGDGHDGFTNRAGNNEFSIGTNPSSASNGTRRYNPSDVFLNGIRVQVLEMKSDSVLIRYASHDPVVLKNQRWCGALVLSDSLSLGKRVQLTLASNKAFVTEQKAPPLTRLTIKAGAVLYLQKRSRLVLESGTTLVLEPGARIIKARGAKIVERGGVIVQQP